MGVAPPHDETARGSAEVSQPGVPGAGEDTRNGRFRRFYAAHLISLVGDEAAPIAVAFAVLQRTHSASSLGLVLASGAIPMTGLVLLGGAWGDRIRKELIMVAANVLGGIAQTALALALLLGKPSLAIICALQAAIGCVRAFYRPAAGSIVPELVPTEKRQRANAVVSVGTNTASVIGPALGGVAVAALGAEYAIAADGLSYLLAALLLLTLLKRRPGTDKPTVQQSAIKDVISGFRDVKVRPWLYQTLVAFAVFDLTFYGVVFVLGPALASHSHDGARIWGLTVSGLGIGAILGGIAAARLRPERPLRRALLGLLSTSPAMAALALHGPTSVVIALFALAGAGIAAAAVLWETTLQLGVPRASLARVSSIDWLASLGLRPLAYALAGPAAAWVGAKTALLVVAGIQVMALSAIAIAPALSRLTWSGLENHSCVPAAN